MAGRHLQWWQAGNGLLVVAETQTQSRTQTWQCSLQTQNENEQCRTAESAGGRQAGRRWCGAGTQQAGGNGNAGNQASRQTQVVTKRHPTQVKRSRIYRYPGQAGSRYPTVSHETVVVGR